MFVSVQLLTHKDVVAREASNSRVFVVYIGSYIHASWKFMMVCLSYSVKFWWAFEHALIPGVRLGNKGYQGSHLFNAKGSLRHFQLQLWRCMKCSIFGLVRGRRGDLFSWSIFNDVAQFSMVLSLLGYLDKNKSCRGFLNCLWPG